MYRLFQVTLKTPNLYKQGARNLFSWAAPGPKVNLIKQYNFAKSAIDKNFPLVRASQFPETLLKNRRGTVSLMNDIASAGPKLSQTLFDPQSDTDGHQQALVNSMDHGENAQRRVANPLLWLKTKFAAFPNGIILVPRELAQAFLTAPDQAKFLEQNKAALSKFLKDTLLTQKQPGWSYEGHYIILGTASLVRCVHHEVGTAADGSVWHVWHMQTTEQHTYDGSFVWFAKYDPKRPGIITSAGFQTGKHPWYDLDTLNVWSGAALFDYVMQAAVYSSRAWESGWPVSVNGVPLSPREHAFIQDILVRVSRAFLECAERFSWIGRYLRGAGNTQAELVVLDDESLEAVRERPELLETLSLKRAENTGITLDGAPLILQEPLLGDRLGPPGATEVAARGEKLLEYQMSQENWERIRDDVLAYAAEKLGPDYVTKSGSELIQTLLGDMVSRLAIEGIISRRLLNPLLPQLQVMINSTSSDQEVQESLAENFDRRFRENVSVPLLTSGGALRSAIQLQVLDEQVKRLNKDTVNGRLADAAARLSAERAAIERLKAQQPKDEAEKEAIEAALAEHEKAEEEAEVDRDRYTEQLRDLTDTDDIREERQRREEEHAEKVFPAERHAGGAE